MLHQLRRHRGNHGERPRVGFEDLAQLFSMEYLPTVNGVPEIPHGGPGKLRHQPEPGLQSFLGLIHQLHRLLDTQADHVRPLGGGVVDRLRKLDALALQFPFPLQTFPPALPFQAGDDADRSRHRVQRHHAVEQVLFILASQAQTGLDHGRTYSEGDQTIEVMAILLSNGFVAFNVRPHPSVDFVLTVDGTEFASADASEVKSQTLISYVWTTTLDWAEDDRVALSLTLKDTDSAEQSEPAENTPATGLPGISGTPQVDQTLTADTSPIDDADGLTNVSYRHQWIAGGTDIAGATGATYTLTASEQGKTIQVQVTFTDDRGDAESLTSVATKAVAAKPVPLTASFSNVPTSHDGSGEFTFDLTFSENFPLSYRTLRDHAFTEDDHGPVTKAQRKVQGSNQTWTITVEPSGNGAITITLPATTDCNATGAICTDDGRKLSNSTSVSVAGPG